ncbi:unnamed protein product, partial [Choristocarpus tenellus]
MQPPPKIPGQVFGGNWINAQGVPMVPGVPSGLEVLAMVDGLMIHQQVEKLEAIAQAIGIGFEGNNKYNISNRVGVQMFQAVEQTGFCWRCCCGALRPAHIRMFDATGHEAWKIQIPLWCPCAWSSCCLEDVSVYHGPKEQGRLIGRVTQPGCGGCCT